MRRSAMTLLITVAMVLGAAAPAAALSSVTNSTPIVGPSGGARGAASPFASTVQVSGRSGPPSYIAVTLHGVTTTSENDLDVMLESPNGQTMLLASDAGGSADITNGELRLRDSAPALPQGSAFVSGDYRPANYAGTCPNRTLAVDDDFSAPAPAPTAPSGTFTPFEDAFKHAQANGTWKLWVMDDCNGDNLSINGGWTLEMQTTSDTGSVDIPATGTSGLASSYPIALPVTGQPDRVTKVNVELQGLAHANPDDLDVLLVGPTGATTQLLSDAGGGFFLDTLDGGVIFADGAKPVPDFDRLDDGTYAPTNYGAGDSYPAPAPGGPYGTALSAFNGTDPNGTWRVFIVDDASGDIGAVRAVKLTITATASGAANPGGGGTGGGSTTTTTVTGTARTSPVTTKDTRVPGALFSGLRGQTLAAALGKGAFGLTLRVDEPSRFAAKAYLPAAKAKGATAAGKKARPTLVATGSGSISAAGSRKVLLRFTKKGRRALKRRTGGAKLAVRVRVTDRAGNRRLVERTVTLRG